MKIPLKLFVVYFLSVVSNSGIQSDLDRRILLEKLLEAFLWSAEEGDKHAEYYLFPKLCWYIL